MSLSANFPTTRPSLLLDFVNSGQMDPRITFSRASGATWFNSAGTLIGVDSSSSSLTVGTGQQTLTLAATAGVDRGWIVGTSVLLSASTVTNTMTGVVVSYTASTQVLVVNVASVVGSGTYSTWQVSNLMPRLDYNPSTLAAQGLLIEEARTNIVASSVYTANANGWTNGVIGGTGTIAAAAVNSPAGTTAGVFNISGLNASSYVGQFATVTASANARTGSVFVRNNGGVKFQIRLVFQTGGTFVSYGTEYDFNTTAFQDGIAGTTAPTSRSVTSVGNGWLRITITASDNGTGNTQASLQFWGAATTANYNYLMWGAQIEEASAGASAAFPTSYIPTTTTALTRAADVASVNTLSPWFNASAGTIYVEASNVATNVGTSGALVGFDDATANNRIITFVQTNGTQPTLRVVASGATQADLATGPVVLGAMFKFASAYAANDFAVSLNGGPPGTDTSGTVPIGQTTLRLGVNVASAAHLNGYLRRITYYPRRLSNAELQAITA
jgi:hypothetical protein